MIYPMMGHWVNRGATKKSIKEDNQWLLGSFNLSLNLQL